MDERTLVMLFLVVEQLRGSDSPWAPYMRLLPSHCPSPLVYGSGQMQQLKGTTLHKATE